MKNDDIALKNEWILLVLGILWCSLALYIYLQELDSLNTPVFIFSGVLIVTSVLKVLFSFSNRNAYHGWGWFMAGGICDVILAIFFLNLGFVISGNSATDLTILSLFLGMWLFLHTGLVLGFTYTRFKLNSIAGILMFFLALAGAFTTIMILLNPYTGSTTFKRWTVPSFLVIGLLNVFQFIWVSLKGHFKANSKNALKPLV